MRRLLVFLLALMTANVAAAEPPPVVRVGSKVFTESVVIGELLVQLARDAGAAAEHRRELGGSSVLWNALLAGDVDAYPEYTGTLTRELLAAHDLAGDDALRDHLAQLGVQMSPPLGFDNTYALGIAEERARALGVRTVSDLRGHPELRFGFSNEFMARGDGWPSLRERYGLPQRNVRGVAHDLAYRGLASGTIDVMELYSTDAEIAYYGLRVLADDRGHFPEYKAVILYRADLEARSPAALQAMLRLAGEIDEDAMVAMNLAAKIERRPESEVAAAFLNDRFGLATTAEVEGAGARLLRLTREHLALVAVSLLAAIFAAVPLGVVAAKRPALGQLILGGAGVLQTIPSLALLVFMIPLLGIGAPPAIAALFLYSLLPIVRNTHAGLRAIPPALRASAEALALPPLARLRLVELPMASPAILAGVKTSAVINVGTATLGALIGAGGYGEPILTGIRLDDLNLILQGAVPAAALALLVQGGFELAERFLVPRGLRLAPER